MSRLGNTVLLGIHLKKRLTLTCSVTHLIRVALRQLKKPSNGENHNGLIEWFVKKRKEVGKNRAIVAQFVAFALSSA